MGKVRIQQLIAEEENRVLDMVYAECKRQGCSVRVATRVALVIAHDEFLMETASALRRKLDVCT